MLRIASATAVVRLVLATQGGAQPTTNTSTTAIDWYPCSQNESLPFDCGTLTVPLDYTNLNSGQYLNLSLVRVNATQQPSRGSILFNPGGPGEIGRSLFVGGADKSFLNFTGGQFDLISFDPRGTGDTIPFSCYKNEVERELEQVACPLSSTASDTAVGSIWACKKLLAENCLQQQIQTGDLIGTAFVARDMMQIVDALDEDGLLRYWGFSYGTALGATVAAMFPDRVDKVVLDGALNMHQYYAGRDIEQVSASDKAFASFIESCAAAPDQCRLARHGLTAQALTESVNHLLESVKYQPLALGATLLDIVEYGVLKNYILLGLKYPTSTWSSLAGLLDAALTQNSTAWCQFSATLTGVISTEGLFPDYGSEALQGIRCSDVSLRTNNLTDIIPIVDELQSTSKYVGDVIAQGQPLTCAQWTFSARERYEGDFQVETRNPIMLVASPFDPLTPLASAQNVSADFEGSVVLQHNGQGHCSISQLSSCTIRTIQDYFVNGTLPAPGTQCNPDLPIFA